MTQANVKFTSFAEYLAWSSHEQNWCEQSLEGRYELVDGELVALPPESPRNDLIANYLFLLLIQAGVPLALVRPGKCEVQVPVLQPRDAANRYPDLVVLRSEHLDLMERRLTITLTMPPPQMIVEVASPGKQNHERDYRSKLAQYYALGVPEYWIVDPQQQMVTVFQWATTDYQTVGEFRESDRVPCFSVPTLALTAEQILAAGA